MGLGERFVGRRQGGSAGVGRGRPGSAGAAARSAVAVLLAVALGGVGLAGCAAPGPGAQAGQTGSVSSGGSAAGATTSTATSPTTATARPTSDPAPTGPVAKRCGRPDGPATLLRLKGPQGSTLSAAVVGSGPTVAVFVHQTGRAGLCGFWPYAVWLADRGVRSVLLDLCGYGESACELGTPFAGDLVAQTGVAVAWARSHGAGRVTLVGASMGGTVVTAAAPTLKPSAVVDLSGPVDFLGLDTAKAGPRLTMPTLVVAADTDPSTDAATLRQVLAKAPARHKRFVSVASGHGWETLAAGPFPEDGFSPVAETVRRWVLGDYGGS